MKNEEFGWVIVIYRGAVDLLYFSGIEKTKKGLSIINWSADNLRAIRFQREIDALLALPPIHEIENKKYLTRIEQHGWI